MEPITLTAALEAGLTWAVVGILRFVAPRLWLRLDKRQLRLAVVAAAATIVAVVGGLMQGLPWVVIAKTALGAFAGSVTLRQATKMQPPTLEYRASDAASIRTRLQ